ncbi:hypothetical protein L227DRAFT_651052 [Lentinus tigrinus ALCF2SS1-6]|uniref:BAG domain-containing protein n=1 Tax=Lentinus tigrinus ALCF2SS1-6 TaxID=1328759 RepID=A0A5C2SJH7_9APHY|nr:hypothetical protein L227DRAFT_651052 [Lentinus tigrinus ALCF2SS1-6]
MLILTPFTSQSYIYSQDAYPNANSAALQEYARVQAIQRQRQVEAYRRQQAAYCVYSRQPSRRRCLPSRPSTYYPVEDLVVAAARREEERRQNLLARQREAQRQRTLALAEAAARQEAERRASALQAQRMQEQQLREAQRRARAREAQRTQEREAFLAFVGLVTQVAAEVESQQHGPVRSHNVPVSSPESAPAPVDRKGKGKAAEVPTQATSVPVSVPAQPVQQVPTMKEELEARIRNETDPDIQESLVLLYSDLFDSPQSTDSQPVAGPSEPKETHFHVPIEESAPFTSSRSAEETQPTTDGAHLHRTPALPPSVATKLLQFYRARRARKLSLGEIKEVEAALRKLEETFEFPEHLDFVNPVPSDAASIESADSNEPGQLAYTSNNTPVHAYENALNALLIRLDAVESNGDLEVRGRRKEIVKEVERALEHIERRIEESRERERERSRERRASSASSLEVEHAVPAVEEETKAEDNLAVAAAEVKVEDTRAAEHTPVTEATPVVEVLSHVADSAIDVAEPAPSTVEVEATPASDASASEAPLEPSASDADAPSSPVPATGEAPAIASEETPASDAVSPPEETDAVAAAPPEAETAPLADPTPRSVEVAEEAAATTPQELEDAQNSTEVPSVASSSEYILPPISISSATADVQPPEAISRIASTASEATDISDATFVTADTEVPPTSTSDNAAAPDIQAPEAISRVASSATDTTDATFATADTELPPPSASDDAATFVSVEATPSPSVPEGNPQPMARAESFTSSSAGEDTFLLSSNPLADKPKRRPSNASDELEIISKEELEAARNDSDWSDLESDSDA